MNSSLIILIFVSLVVGVASYVALNNIFITIGIIAVYLLVSILLFVPQIKRYQIKVRKFHECYHFINNFVISLSIKKSIAGSLESTVNSMPNEFIEIYEGLENMNDKEKLQYFSTYFSFYVYQLFLQIVDLWEESGGDILVMSKFLINEVRHNEEYISKCETIISHKYTEIGILWLFCIAIVVILRFSLNDFYLKIQSQPFYIIAISCLFLFILINIYLLIQKGIKLQIRGYNENEKKL